jgi:hypothetical protein
MVRGRCGEPHLELGFHLVPFHPKLSASCPSCPWPPLPVFQSVAAHSSKSSKSHSRMKKEKTNGTLKAFTSKFINT